MNRQQLIDYLTAVCDAESAAQSCRDNLATLEQRKSMVASVRKPYKPVLSDPVDVGNNTHFSHFRSDDYFAMCKGVAIVSVIISFFVAVDGSSGLSDLIGEMIAYFFVVSIICLPLGFIIMAMIEKHKVGQKRKKKISSVAKANRQAEEEYALRLHAYNASTNVRTHLIFLLDEAIKKQNDLLAQATQRLDTLYNMNILHSSCRNMIAAYQMRQYLEMGICETLEGPDGAYKQYQFDVLAQRVCTSIDDLKKSLVSAIHSLQSALVQELRTINGNVEHMSNVLHDDLQKVNGNISMMQDEMRENRAQIDIGFQEANKHLANINRNLSIAAHNDYIEKRINDVDIYLLRAPNRVP